MPEKNHFGHKKNKRNVNVKFFYHQNNNRINTDKAKSIQDHINYTSTNINPRMKPPYTINNVLSENFFSKRKNIYKKIIKLTSLEQNIFYRIKQQPNKFLILIKQNYMTGSNYYYLKSQINNTITCNKI